MSTSKLVPNDPRVERKEAKVRGKTYSYLHGKPEGGETPKGAVLLVHGFPDFSFGWRYQIPQLQAMGYEVIAPDTLGYGHTDAPDGIEPYTQKEMAHDMAALAEAVLGPNPRVVLGGHDWGGSLVWRTAMYHPELVVGVFSICTPYFPPNPRYFSLESLVNSGRLPTFRYQLQFISGDVEANVKTDDDIRQALVSIYGGRTADGQFGFSAEKGFKFDLFGQVGSSPHVSKEEEDHYVENFARNGLHGPLNWYRTRELAFADEQPFVEKGWRFEVPCFFASATKDLALTPELAKGMGAHFDDLTTKSVDAGHWALWQRADEINAMLKAWFAEKIEGKAAGVKAVL
ncbi:hypothetical protein ACHAQF_003936 [Verticillium nonalfalfae]